MLGGARVLKLVQLRRSKVTLFGPSVAAHADSGGYGAKMLVPRLKAALQVQFRPLLLQLIQFLQMLLGNAPSSSTAAATSVQAKL